RNLTRVIPHGCGFSAGHLGRERRLPPPAAFEVIARMKVLIAGGGTGGHLFPGIALAEEVVTRHHANDVLFVGTARGLEARVVPKSGFKLELIETSGVKGRGLSGW